MTPSSQSRRRAPEPDGPSAAAFKRHHRRCLNCRAMFDSAWAGERICLRCKGTTVWRNGGSTSVANMSQGQSRSARRGTS